MHVTFCVVHEIVKLEEEVSQLQEITGDLDSH